MWLLTLPATMQVVTRQQQQLNPYNHKLITGTTAKWCVNWHSTTRTLKTQPFRSVARLLLDSRLPLRIETGVFKFKIQTSNLKHKLQIKNTNFKLKTKTGKGRGRAMDRIILVYPQTCSIHTPEPGSTFQMIMVLSIDADRRARLSVSCRLICWPEGAQQTLYTQSSWPVRRASKLTAREVSFPDLSTRDIRLLVSRSSSSFASSSTDILHKRMYVSCEQEASRMSPLSAYDRERQGKRMRMMNSMYHSR